MNEQYISRIKDIMSHFKFHYYKILGHQENKDLMEFIDSWSEKLINNRLSTKIFWILHDIHDFPRCKQCGKLMNRDEDIDLKRDRYRTYCSNRCACSSSERNEKRKKTNNRIYGGNAPICNDEVKRKTRETCLEKYGVEYAIQSQGFKDKIKDTMLKRYGVEYAAQNEDIKHKTVETCLKRYGTTNGGCSKEALEKIRKTNQDRYGVNCSFEREEVREKAKNTNLRKYGSEYFTSSMRRADYNYIKSRKSYRETILTNKDDQPMFSEEEYIKYHLESSYHEFEFRCNKCGNVFKSFHRNGIHSKCPKCFRKTEKFEENCLYDFLKLIFDDSVVHGIGGRRIIPPFELDFYIPSKKLAFEFDGLYWHSDWNGKDKHYHLTKTEMCDNIGVQLIHIFEDEWNFKQSIVKSRIKNLLGIYDSVTYARKCFVANVPKEDADRFLDENHIQGCCVDRIRLGLYHNGELVSIMTFGKPRFNRKYEWELLRFCNKIGYHIPGAAGKLLKTFERQYKPSNIISYADRRWSVGKLYHSLGFKLHGMSEPSYFYIKHMQRFSRIKFQKHKLKAILENFDEKLTEVENMKNNGYFRIWDCGNMVFVKEFESSEILKS